MSKPCASLPLDIAYMISKHLTLNDYHNFRFASITHNLATLPTLTWEAYEESAKDGKNRKDSKHQDLSKVMKPELTFIDSHRLNRLNCHHQHTLVNRVLTERPSSISDAVKIRIFRRTVNKGWNNTFHILLKHTDVAKCITNSELLRIAAQNGNVDIFQTLHEFPLVNPAEEHNETLRIASKNGHLDILRVLLKDERCNPADNDNEAIIQASTHGHHLCVKLLLNDPRTNPAARLNLALRNAAKSNKIQSAAVLLRSARVRQLHKQLLSQNANSRTDSRTMAIIRETQRAQQIYQMIKSERQSFHHDQD